MDVYENLKWKEITTNKVRVFQLDEEPEVFYLIKIRDNEYMIVHEDGYDMNTGKVEFLNKEQVIGKYGIEI
jgi:NMD protein affecting ribosome stability and mRNA decay